MAGLTDKPIEKNEDDYFGLKKYVNGLSGYILECDTPTTIAIQGDWGTGKTSMMNMIREKLGDDVVPIWFNTWQFSKFNLDNQLTISLLTCLSQELAKICKKNKNSERLSQAISIVAKTGSYVIDAFGAQKLADSIESIGDKLIHNQESAVQVLQMLKNDFQNMINQIYEEQKKRVVIFIDDLDRLEPAKAVDLLEVLKLFLDCENCVYLLAIDYAVVTKGISEKYGADFKQGKQFFDKIIQVPFLVPIAHYDIKKYVLQSMQKININLNDENLEEYIELIRISVGYNARAMKRLFNAYWLICKIYAEDNLESDDYKKKILFATLCLQLSYEAIYNYIIDHLEDLDVEFFEYFLTDYGQDAISCFEKGFKDLSFDKDEDEIEDILEFMHCMCKMMVDKDGKILIENVSSFREILQISSTTSSVNKVKKATENVELKEDCVTEKRISATDAKYKICTAGAKFHIGFGKPIIVEMNGKEYTCKMHSLAKGRIDGMSKLFAENSIQEGDYLRLSYFYQQGKVFVERESTKESIVKQE